MRVSWVAPLALVFASSFASGQIVISEVLYDPVGVDDGAELVELHNPTAATVDLSRWSLCLNNPVAFGDRFYYEFQSGRTMAPGSYLTMHWRASGVGDATNVFTDSEGAYLFFLGSTTIHNPASALSLYEDNDATYSAADYANPALIRDFVQIGQPDLLRETVAVAAGIWFNNDRVVTWPEGWTTVYDLTGDFSSDYYGDAGGFIAGDNGINFAPATTYSTGCPAPGGAVPFIPPADNIPTDPDIGFQVTVLNGEGSTAMLMMIGTQQLNAPFGQNGCILLNSLNFRIGPFQLQNTGPGEGTLHLGSVNPIPGSGLQLFFQYFVFTSPLSTTNGLDATF